MHYSVDLRRKVLEFVKESGSQTEASRVFNINRSTIYRWSQRENLAPSFAKTRQRKLVKANVLQLVKEQNDARLVDYAAQLGVTHQAVWVAFKRWGIIKKTDPLRGKEVYKTDWISPNTATPLAKLWC